MNAQQPTKTEKDDFIGSVLLGEYEIIELVGIGAMARVYKAKQLSTSKYVALKRLTATEPDVVARFSKEIRVHSKLRHRNIVKTHGCINDPKTGEAFFVMDFVSGRTLQQRIKENGPEQREDSIILIVGQLCDALTVAHEQGVIHRDLKPANVILIEKGAGILVQVLDFGLAKVKDEQQQLTMPGKVVGSPVYMSPEQCKGKPLDPRADVYSLGCLIYELIAGRVPYKHSSLMETMAAHCHPEMRPDPIGKYANQVKHPEALNEVLQTALQVERDSRYQSVSELKSAMESWYLATKSPNVLPGA